MGCMAAEMRSVQVRCQRARGNEQGALLVAGHGAPVPQRQALLLALLGGLLGSVALSAVAGARRTSTLRPLSHVDQGQ
jgi:hypothetical protein